MRQGGVWGARNRLLTHRDGAPTWPRPLHRLLGSGWGVEGEVPAARPPPAARVPGPSGLSSHLVPFPFSAAPARPGPARPRAPAERRRRPPPAGPQQRRRRPCSCSLGPRPAASPRPREGPRPGPGRVPAPTPRALTAGPAAGARAGARADAEGSGPAVTAPSLPSLWLPERAAPREGTRGHVVGEGGSGRELRVLGGEGRSAVKSAGPAPGDAPAPAPTVLPRLPAAPRAPPGRARRPPAPPALPRRPAALLPLHSASGALCATSGGGGRKSRALCF